MFDYVVGYLLACLFVCVCVCLCFIVCLLVVCRFVWLLGFLGHAVNDTSKHSLILSSTLAHRKRRGPDFLPHTVHKWIR